MSNTIQCKENEKIDSNESCSYICYIKRIQRGYRIKSLKPLRNTISELLEENSIDMRSISLKRWIRSLLESTIIVNGYEDLYVDQ